ncbi:carboxypeptidase-like regulatory domain-containing protein [Bacteroides gallinaceum]|nr:carboxypeptidase-like regulatory domain-containing protein [Bacteroides gallinaceum]
MKMLLMLLSVLVSCLDGIAQTVSRISGTVVEYKDDAALPVPSATVSLWRTDSTLVNNTTSDLKGKFQLKDIAGGDYFLKVSCIGYAPAYVALKGLKDKLDMGIIELVPEAAALDEVAVEANSIVRKIDRMVVYPSADAVKHSYDPYDLIANLMIPRLHVNQFNKALETDGGSVQIRINGVKATQAEYLAIPAEDIKRIEVVDNPGMRYGDTGIGMVVDLIVKRREIGGTVYAKIMSCPYQLHLDPTFSLKLNHKKSQWGVYYSSTFRDAKKSYFDTDESFYLGDRVIHRIKEGLYAPYRNAWHNIDLTYNLYDVDNYTLNVAFHNSLYNVPYGDSRSRMYDAGNPDYIISHTQSDSHSYTPSLPHQKSPDLIECFSFQFLLS